MVKRLFDIIVSLLAIALLAPVLVLAAVAIRVTSPGPVIYRARRAGRNGVEFIMYKFRTMHVVQSTQSAITGANDVRVFPVGRILRATKIDELPQLINVVLGQMSIVGPRPEDPRIVAQHYGPLGLETLSVRPGLASYGSLYNYTHGHLVLGGSDAEQSYVRELLPLKLALEVNSVRNASLAMDFDIIVRTLVTILRIAAGQREFREPRQLEAARKILASSAENAIVIP